MAQGSRNGRTILVAEDEPEVRGYLEMALKCLGYSVELAQDGDEAVACLRSAGNISGVLLDIMMPSRDGIDALREIRRYEPNLPVIVVSGASSPLNIVAAMKNGATDFLCKPVPHDELQRALSRAFSDLPAMPAPQPSAPARAARAYIGSNPRMKEIQAILGQIGWSEAPVLIQGETGSGKEVIARELHANSPRASKPFLKLNCAALPSELVESELFGYERGAFTGAFQKKAGMFELADGGTILLDEIGDMDVRLQAKLLQVLQDHEFQRLGGKETIQVDVRVMAATHRDLERAILDRTFREDLYYRLNVLSIHLPPLRERKEDIAQLAEFLIRKYGTPADYALLTTELRHAMMSHHWPGNVRELENFVRKLLILRTPDSIARELHLKAGRRALLSAPRAEARPPAENHHDEQNQPILEQVSKAKEQAESEAIVAALNSTRWNRKQAANLLKIDYKALLYKMKKLGIEDRPASFVPNAAFKRAAASGTPE